MSDEKRILTYREAIREGLIQEMTKDESVILMGEDVGRFGGIFGVTRGVADKFQGRVFDTPISESAFVGCGIGAAMTGLRPVVELMFFDFSLVALDQIANHAAKLRFLTGGKVKIPLTIRSPYGASMRYGPQHSQSLYSIFVHFPGLKVVIPSDPYHAKGLMASSIKDDNPVLFLEHKALYSTKGECPENDYYVPLGKARIVLNGTDLTIVATGLMLARALEAAKELGAKGIKVEVIDPQSLAPLDKDTIINSVKRTHRLLIVDEDYPKCGFAEHVLSEVYSETFGILEAPVKLLTPPDTQIPFSPKLEDIYIPSVETITNSARKLLAYGKK